MKKPRPFNHKPIFLDARQEELHARQEQLHALRFSSKRQHQKGGGMHLSIPMLLSLLLILAATALVLLYSNS